MTQLQSIKQMKANSRTVKLSASIENALKKKTLLITGGAGSIGAALTKALMNYPVKSVRILDIDEYGLFKLKRSINDTRLRLLFGSILDKERIEMAGNGADIIIHTAAIKNIEISEFNPIETLDVNINGTVNLIKMCMKNNPEKFLNVSTDKAVDSSTLYGTTKQLGEKLTSWAGAHFEKTQFASVRLGNIFESRGNVFEIWREESKNNQPLSITHPSMKRYFFHISDAVNFILQCLPRVNKGEIFVPKMKSYAINELASKISKKHKIVGLRQGEKIQELLMNDFEKSIAKEEKNMWIIKHYDKYALSTKSQ